MSKHDLAARPIYDHTRESVVAHLTIVFAALAVSRLVEATTGWSIKKFVIIARRYRTMTAADPHPRRPTSRSGRHPGQTRWPKSGSAN